MKRRLEIVLALALAFTVGIVTPARAQEVNLTPRATWITPEGSPELRHQLSIARMRAESAVPFSLDASMKEVRLSHGAKVAIIVTAIVVGALIIVGAVALSQPGKHLP
jgi:hypothetical protein